MTMFQYIIYTLLFQLYQYFHKYAIIITKIGMISTQNTRIGMVPAGAAMIRYKYHMRTAGSLPCPYERRKRNA